MVGLLIVLVFGCGVMMVVCVIGFVWLYLYVSLWFVVLWLLCLVICICLLTGCFGGLYCVVCVAVICVVLVLAGCLV